MSRPASADAEVLKSARQAIASAQTVEQLRQAQAVVLPLDYGLSLAQTAQVIGVSPGWACQLRRRFMQGQIAGAFGAPAAGGRKRQNMTLQEEREFLAHFLKQAATGGVLVVGQIKAALDKRLGRKVALASAYNLASTATTGESLPPTSATHKAILPRRTSGKKTPRNTCRNPQCLGTRQNRQADVLQDEARFGRISDVRRCWAPKPLRPICQAMLTHEYTYAYGVVDVYARANSTA